ncbi:hypothetical protein V493_01245 [Pseudogymnoascus sp. VKM F-4281 (FW-2241)]|nr:hypothetical protein V493_01245 [Pseudogymnoascus sp. VKM F-4281 (FW-2241)]
MVSTRASSKRKRSSSTRDDQNVADYQDVADLSQPKHREQDAPTRLDKLQTVGSHGRAVLPAQEQNTTFSRPPSSTLSHPIIVTIGHGTRTLSTLIDLLQSAPVTRLVDVRSIPRSYTNPQFNHDDLVTSTELKAANIEYIWCGAKLGGRRNAKQPNVGRHTAIRVTAFRNYAGYMSTQNFRDGLEELKALSKSPLTYAPATSLQTRPAGSRASLLEWQVEDIGHQALDEVAFLSCCVGGRGGECEGREDDGENDRGLHNSGS